MKKSKSKSIFPPGLPSARSSQRPDLLHMPVININELTRNDVRTTLSFTNFNDQSQQQQQQQQISRPVRPVQTNERTKSIFVESSKESLVHHRQSFSSDHDEQNDNDEDEIQAKAIRKYPTPAHTEENNTSISDVENLPVEENVDQEVSTKKLDENARRLLMLGTIRPSRTFYRNLPEADVDHLMTYFRRMKQTNQKVNSEEINQELAAKHVEYKPKICTSN